MYSGKQKTMKKGGNKKQEIKFGKKVDIWFNLNWLSYKKKRYEKK